MNGSTTDSPPVTGSAEGGLDVKRILLLGAGTALLILYLRGLDFSAVPEAASRFSLGMVVLVVSLNLFPGALKYLRWRHFLGRRGLAGGGFRSYLAVNASFYLGLVTPGTVGELSRAFVAGEGETGRATAVVAFEKLTDLVVLLILVVGSAAVQFTTGPTSWLVVGAAVLLVGAGHWLFLRFDNLVTAPVKFLLERVVSRDRKLSLRDAYWEFYELAQDRRLTLVSVVVSALLWIVTLAQMHLIFAGLGWELPLKTTALALFLPYLVGVVSMVPLGLGAFELTMARVSHSGLAAGVVGDAAMGPLFFRVLVTVPLIVGGYACHLLVMMMGKKERP